jgi:pimeloyl-ACP methyl ester carboxylesterase
MGSLLYQGYRIRYDEYGTGDRAIVLIHGLLLNRRIFERLGRELAKCNNRVICVDLLGHGDSDQPEDRRLYSTPLFARQVMAVLNHLELETAVVGGTSLGANVALELAVHDPDRIEGLFLELPILDNALERIGTLLAPLLLGLRRGQAVLTLAARIASRIPRTNLVLDFGLDLIRRQPGPSVSVLEGLLLGETPPRPDERREITQPVLVVGHPRDPLHTFSDSGMLAGELPEARLVEAESPLQWQFKSRLTGELARFLDEVWAEAEEARTGSVSKGNGRRHLAVAR